MITRKPSTISKSLVNSAKEEIYTTKGGIHTDTTVSDLDSVVESINFEYEKEGTLSLRKPLILKEKITDLSYLLYDKEHFVKFSNEKRFSINILTEYNIETNPIYNYELRWNDKSLKSHSKAIPLIQDTQYISLDFINLINFYNLQDSTIMIVEINHTLFKEFTDNPNTDGLVYDDLNYGNILKRFIKIYYDDEVSKWVLDIITPEISTIISGLDTGNASSIVVNLLADNPYAIRDLYNYGDYTVTKIVPYVTAAPVQALSDSYTVKDLTESKCTANEGFKQLVSINNLDTFSRFIVLKAFITTSETTNSRYYCTWEESTDNGVSWHPCNKFINKFLAHDVTPIEYHSVLDITSEEFTKLLESEENNTLDSVGQYLVTKPMVLLNPSALSETNYLKDRPDILSLGNSDFNKYYRFKIYLDTGKAVVPAEDIVKSISKSYFSSTSGIIDDAGIIEYSTAKGNSLEDVSVSDGQIILHKAPVSSSSTRLSGNSITISPKASKYNITKIKIRIGSLDPSELVTLNCKVQLDTFDTDIVLTSQGDYTFTFTTPVTTSAVITNYSTSVDCPIYLTIVTYSIPSTSMSTSTYEHSSTGAYHIPYSKQTEFVKDLTIERNNLFNGKLLYWNSQIVISGGNYLYASNVDSFIFDIMKMNSFGSKIVKAIPWRNYLIIFTLKDISLATYDISSDIYSFKVLSNSIGIPEVDSETVVVILNSVYFKAGFKIYKLIPNLYASKDDTLNIHVISSPIEALLENKLDLVKQYSNFAISDAEKYRLYIPLSDTQTYCIIFDLEKKIWTMQSYPIRILGMDVFKSYNSYLKTPNGYCYFKDNLDTILKNYYINNLILIGAIEDYTIAEYAGIGYQELDSTSGEYLSYNICISSSEKSYNLESLYDKIPYADYLSKTVFDIYTYLLANVYGNLESFKSFCNPTQINFKIDFGQKSSNYIFDKQFLETKFIFSTLQEKDCFPMDIYISTDGNGFSTINSSRIHIDANTDSALWKNTILQKGTLNTSFNVSEEKEISGIMRQMIIKYSGRGKTIRHVLSGISYSRFKIYALVVRSRILPKKQ